MVTSIQNAKSSVRDYDCYSKTTPKSECKSLTMIYTNIDIPVSTYCGTINLNLSRASLGKLDRIHERAVGIITKTNTVKLTPIMTYVKRNACQIVRTSIAKQLLAVMINYSELLSHSKSTRNNRLSIALPRVRTKAAQKGFYYQGAMIYNSLTRDIRMQGNETLF